jgi:hypothetical protein
MELVVYVGSFKGGEFFFNNDIKITIKVKPYPLQYF